MEETITTPEPTRRKSSLSSKQSKETLSRRHSERHQVVKIQNYVIYRKTIGAGSMGKVKLAECLTDVDKQKYAVKIMPKVDLSVTDRKKSKDPKDTPEEREQRTIREMAIMRLLRHPNICQLKEYITEGDKYYMFLEYVDGGQLLDYIIKHGKLKEKQARKFARQIISALDYCHRNSIVHRDLKIENILITKSEQLKIIDFGLSNVYSPTEQLNTFCGSLYFAAPELLKAKEYTGPEVDVWSFGVVLYVLVCGRVPFDDSNLPALHEKIKSGIVEDYPDHLGKDCLDLLHKIFVVDPTKRITLSAIQAHPWMNKGYEEPIRNYLPHRQPLENIDMDIVNGMHGFGLGAPEEIKAKLEKIVSSAAYQVAAIKIDQNFQKKVSDDQSLAAKPKWRRTLSTRRSKVPMQDDFQSLPAMYDPLVSIYYLVKERKESDERKKQLLESETNAITLSRSTSTLVVSKNPLEEVKQPTLTRRRTFDTTKKLPDLPPASDFIKDQPSTPHPTKSVSSRTPSLLRRKSLQAVKKLGIKLANQEPANDTSNISTTSSSSDDLKDNSVASNNAGATSSKAHWLKLSNRNKSTTSTDKRQSTSSMSSVNNKGWRRMSISRKANATRTSLDATTTADENKPRSSSSSYKNNSKENKPLVIESSKSETISTSKSLPKSLSFNFNRGHLYRTTSADIFSHLQHILSTLQIQIQKQTEFCLSCACPYSIWSQFLGSSSLKQTSSEEKTRALLKFNVMIYEARWAGGKIGFKLRESEEQAVVMNFYIKQLLKYLNTRISNELNQIYSV